MPADVYSERWKLIRKEGDYNRKLNPVESEGDVRSMRIEFSPETILATNQTVSMGPIPQGTVHIHTIIVDTDGLASGRTLDFGHSAYVANDLKGSDKAEDKSRFVSGIDVATAGTHVGYSTEVIDSKNGAELYMTIKGGSFPTTRKVVVMVLFSVIG